MKNQDITLTPAERRQIVATRDTLAHLREVQNYPVPVTATLVGLEMVLASACPHNPELHTLRDVLCGWEVTCHACEASWFVVDSTALLDAYMQG